MKTFTLLTQLAASVSVIMAQFGPAPLTVDTPASLTECEPVLVQWSGADAPLPFSVFNAGTPTEITEELGEVDGTTFTWTVNIAAGEAVGFEVVDAAGSIAQSATSVIQPGDSVACLGD
ncbi:hypothetical protein BDP27DRAFT_1344928 [Rhodocollybia butyracea]|uniref:Uncharacterized protein n=1 Tax=Rhodocollybia butyracea TaxID=206335 RepID=A0A9P5P6B5_9AGAR|nr:hypothetical protein BDP27DRAFT_1344928 [Rhodocollybia butyracea]